MFHERLGGIGEIHSRHAVGKRVQDPGTGRRSGSVALQGDAAWNRPHVGAPQHGARGRIHREQPARCRRRGHQRGVVRAHGNGERRGKRHVLLRMLGRQRLQLEPHRLAAACRAIEGRDLVQEGAVLQLGQAVALRAGLAVGVVAGFRLGDEHPRVGVHSDTVEQRAEGVHDFDEFVRGGVEDVQVAVRDVRVAHDVRHVASGKALRGAANRLGDVFAGIEGTQHAVDVLLPAAGDLRLVVGLERHDVQAVAAHRQGARVLRGDLQMANDAAPEHVHHRDAVGGRERDVCLAVAREGDAHRLVEARGFGGGVDGLDGR